MDRARETNLHPGIIFKEDVIEANELTVGMTADLLGVSRLTVSKIINAKSAITPNIAIRIAMVFGGSADFWLRMQRGYDLIKEKIKFETNPPNLKRFVSV